MTTNSSSPVLNLIQPTRILLLSNFDPQLKTKDLLALFSNFEEDRGGFKLKWLDETSCYIVFQDHVIAKRAFLSLLTSPPPSFTATATDTAATAPKVTPYTGSDTPTILAAVSTRPRARSNSNAGGSGHMRNGSNRSSIGGYAGVTGNDITNGGHARNRSNGSFSASTFGGYGLNPAFGFGGAGVNRDNTTNPPKFPTSQAPNTINSTITLDTSSSTGTGSMFNSPDVSFVSPIEGSSEFIAIARASSGVSAAGAGPGSGGSAWRSGSRVRVESPAPQKIDE